MDPELPPQPNPPQSDSPDAQNVPSDTADVVNEAENTSPIRAALKDNNPSTLYHSDLTDINLVPDPSDIDHDQSMPTLTGKLCGLFICHRRKMFTTVAISLLAIVVLAMSIAIPKNRSAPASASNGASSGNIPLERLDGIKNRIIEEGVSKAEQLEEIGSAQQMALNWIAKEDPQGLPSTDEMLINRYVLAVIFFSTDGPGDSNYKSGWVNSENWLSGTGFCNWHGIECHHNSQGQAIYDDNVGIRVVALDDNNLRYKIPSEVGFLQELHEFKVRNNTLTGSIPDSIVTIVSLQKLNLGENLFSGTIPVNMGYLSDLQHLYLDGNFLSGSIPNSIASLVNLQWFGVYENELVGTIPENIGNLVKLYTLYLDTNELTGTIPSIEALTRVSDLRLHNNNLSGTIPKDVARLDKLEILYLDYNGLTGTIPSEMAFMKSIRHIHLYNNKLDGVIPIMIGAASTLESFHADHNKLIGSIPDSIVNLRKLDALYLYKNSLTGSIPADIGKMTSLRKMRLYGNTLKGEIPSGIGDLERLEELFLETNELDGTIPEALGNLNHLKKLRIQSNLLDGAVPDGVCSLRKKILKELQSDCGGADPSVTCSCCTDCF